LCLRGNLTVIDLPDEQREQFSVMLRDARRTLGLHQYQVAAATGVPAGTLGMLERNGPYPSLRAIDLLRIVAYYGLDIFRVSYLIGVTLGEASQEAAVLPQQTIVALSSLSDEDRTYVIGVLNVLLRGVRER
jgi:transcriptional regulator with XRE-family HTH domain